MIFKYKIMIPFSDIYITQSGTVQRFPVLSGGGGVGQVIVTAYPFPSGRVPSVSLISPLDTGLEPH